MNNTLKLCPHCGELPHFSDQYVLSDKPAWDLVCSNQKCHFKPRLWEQRNKEEMICLWNQRPREERLEKLLGEAREELMFCVLALGTNKQEEVLQYFSMEEIDNYINEHRRDGAVHVFKALKDTITSIDAALAGEKERNQ